MRNIDKKFPLISEFLLNENWYGDSCTHAFNKLFFNFHKNVLAPACGKYSELKYNERGRSLYIYMLIYIYHIYHISVILSKFCLIHILLLLNKDIPQNKIHLEQKNTTLTVVVVVVKTLFKSHTLTSSTISWFPRGACELHRKIHNLNTTYIYTGQIAHLRCAMLRKQAYVSI